MSHNKLIADNLLLPCCTAPLLVMCHDLLVCETCGYSVLITPRVLSFVGAYADFFELDLLVLLGLDGPSW